MWKICTIATLTTYRKHLYKLFVGAIGLFGVALVLMYVLPSADDSFAYAQDRILFLQTSNLNQLIEDDQSSGQHDYSLSARKNGQLYYWNNFKSPSRVDNRLLIERKNDKNSGTKWSLEAEIIDDQNRLSPWLFSSYYSEYDFIKSPDPTPYSLTIRDQQYHFTVVKRSLHRSKLKVIFIGLFILSFMGVFLIFLNNNRLKSLNPTELGLQLVILFFIRIVIYGICTYSPLSELQILSRDNYFNFFTPSIGDLIFNTLFFIAGVILVTRTSYLQLKSGVSGSIQRILWISSVYLLYVYVASISKAAVFSSGIQLNAEAVLDFDAYSFSFIIILIFNLFLLFILHYMSIEWLSKMKLSRNQRNITYVVACATILPINIIIFDLSFAMILGIFLIALSLLIDIFWGVLRKSIVWIIWWIMIYAAFLAIILFAFGIQKRILDRQEYLQSIYVNTDNQILQDLKMIISNKEIQLAVEKLTTTSLPSQFDKKDLREYLSQFDLVGKLGLPWTIKLFSPNGTNVLKYEYQNKSGFISSFQYLRLVDEHIYFDHLSGTYIGVLQGTQDSDPTEALNLNIVLSSIKTSKKSIDTNFSIYQNNTYITGHRDNERPNDLFTNLSSGAHYSKNRSVLIENPNGNNEVKIISSEPVANLIKPISLFSYLFCIIGIFLVLMIILLRSAPHDKTLFHIDFEIVPLKSLRTRLQLSVVALVIFSFLVIGLVTVFFFSNEIQKTQKTEDLNKVKLLLKDIDSRLSQAIDNESASAIFINNVFDLKAVHNCDFNLYKNSGELIVSTLPEVKSLRYPYRYFKTFSQEQKREAIITEDRTKGSLYIPLNPIGKGDVGILEIISLETLSSRFQITDFISTILNVYVFLFLLAGAIAISIANSITRPLSQLSDNLKRTRIGKKNEALEWDSSDEVGELIQTYNQMITELDSSAEMLAQTERDLAWREMAKQVAHEIKNPLTPMKLSIQYLERAIEADPENASRLISKVSTTLVEQIDNLSQIAGEFSNFGTMPQANNEKIILNEIVEAVHDLFRKREDMDIKLVEPINDIYVYADRNHLVRILNNLLKNSIQAIPDDRRGHIIIELYSINGNAVISVKDNGKGIPEHMKSKVFTPNFTTKSSGTGLGLAISANMIESFNGKIYFDSVVQEGTTFYIEVPLMHLDDNRDTTNRVFLD